MFANKYRLARCDLEGRGWTRVDGIEIVARSFENMTERYIKLKVEAGWIRRFINVLETRYMKKVTSDKITKAPHPKF